MAQSEFTEVGETPTEHRSRMHRLFDRWFHGHAGAEQEEANVAMANRARHLEDGADHVSSDAETVRIHLERERRKRVFNHPKW